MKKRLLVLLTVLLVLAACTPGAFAYDVAAEQAADFGTASLESALPEQAYDAFGELSVADAAQPQSLLAKLWAYVLHEGGGAVASAARNAALLLAIVFLSALCASLSVSGACGKVTQMAGTVAVAALSVTHVTSCITAGSEALATLRDFSKILLPSMCAAAAASGAATSAAAKYAATSLFLDVLLSAETAVLLPLLYLYAGTVICGTTLENDVLASLSGLLRKAFRLLLIGFASVFTLYLSLTGILTGSADAAAAKAVKTAVSAALPVVGSIVADAASTVTSSAAILRSGIGVVGVVSVAAVCVTPYLQLRRALCPVQACRRNRRVVRGQACRATDRRLCGRVRFPAGDGRRGVAHFVPLDRVEYEGGDGMMESVRNWLLSLAGVALLTVLASLFPTSESLRRVTKLAGGVALTCLLFSPLVTFDYDAYAAALQDYHVSVSTDGAVSDSSERLQRTVIESEMRTYILDKAAQCGAALDDAQVTLQWSTDGYWYPQSVRLVTSGPAAENSRLAQIIEADLGVPRTRQEWSSTS